VPLPDTASRPSGSFSLRGLGEIGKELVGAVAQSSTWYAPHYGFGLIRRNKMSQTEYWVVRSARHNHENEVFDSEAEALAFAQTGDVLAHVRNGCEESHRPIVK
jgi:hypothetical protein